MLSTAMQDAINEQINKELYSGYLYLSMAAYFESTGLPGFATWMRAQSQEELEHALKFFDYVNERGGRVELEAIEKPTVAWESPLAVFEATYEHEQMVTALINNLYKVALEENDYASQVMLHWFIDEQVEEEASVSQIVDSLERVGDKGQGLIMLDRALGQRGA
jgi:ferritin